MGQNSIDKLTQELILQKANLLKAFFERGHLTGLTEELPDAESALDRKAHVEGKTYLIPTSNGGLMPNIKVSLPRIIVETTSTSTKMRGITRAGDIAISFVSNDTIGVCDIRDVTTDYIARSVSNSTQPT